MVDSSDKGAFKIFVHSVSHEVPDLTDDEREKLEAVIQKAKEFDEEEQLLMKKPVEGQLYKYTNVVRGWQFRWFVLTPETGMLEYYMMDEPKKNRPKGGLHLAGAAILQSEEDANSFTINAICGEIFRLKAVDAKERQFWVTKLRATSEMHTGSPIEVPYFHNRIHRTSSASSRELSSTEPSPKSASSSVFDKRLMGPRLKSANSTNFNKDIATPSHQSPLAPIKECVDSAYSSQKSLIKLIEQLPVDGPHLRCCDANLLLLKATAQATCQSLEYCYLILKEREHARENPKGLPVGATIQWVDSKKPV